MKTHRFILSIFAVFSTSPLVSAEEEKPLEVTSELREQVSSGVAYLKGKELVAELRKQGYEVSDFSLEAFAEGFAEAMMGKDSSIKMADFRVALNLMNAKLQERELLLAKSNLEVSAKWMKNNAKKEGVKITKNGMQYEVIKSGEGKVTAFNTKELEPKKRNRFFISYANADTEGVVFEGSPQKKLVGLTETPIKGLAEALNIMPVGSHWKLYLKPQLAYGARRVGAVLEPNAVVVMDVLLSDVKPANSE
ncbi:FKBP-type peptidyl-prolyl cis-trans isomerase N-terminal domain-containing protein [Rubritalea sp.]|uniref:FKBP-type peptidyl-prolyl cis-trans isomerase N-terminal domain-containing protein n=1 Tax=Rubritalea sp. TaxID=2109375 RepID=UPI003EF9EBB9